MPTSKAAERARLGEGLLSVGGTPQARQTLESKIAPFQEALETAL